MREIPLHMYTGVRASRSWPALGVSRETFSNTNTAAKHHARLVEGVGRFFCASGGAVDFRKLLPCSRIWLLATPSRTQALALWATMLARGGAPHRLSERGLIAATSPFKSLQNASSVFIHLPPPLNTDAV